MATAQIVMKGREHHVAIIHTCFERNAALDACMVLIRLKTDEPSQPMLCLTTDPPTSTESEKSPVTDREGISSVLGEFRETVSSLQGESPEERRTIAKEVIEVPTSRNSYT